MYIANVENSEIDVSGIRTVLVQGDSAYPSIRFVLDPSLTGLSWRVRGTYTATNIAVLSPEITPTESATEITLDWSVGSDFTTYDGDMQLSLVGVNDAGTTVVKALAEITIQKDWSIGTTGTITLNLFEQLMAQIQAMEHNDFSGIQGGSLTERYHLTAAEHTIVGNTSGVNTGDQNAAEVSNTPAGSISATDVQAAINELDSEKEAASNKVTSISSASTDVQYPSAKAVYSAVAPLITNHNWLYDGRDLSAIFTAAEFVAAIQADKWSNIRVGDYWPIALTGTFRDYGYYTCPSGTNYYSDTGLTTLAGQTTTTYQATYVDATYCSIVISATTYYVSTAACLDYYARTLSGAVHKMEVAAISPYMNYGDTALTSPHVLMISRDCVPQTLKMRKSLTAWTDAAATNPWIGSALYKTLNEPTYGILPLVAATDIGAYIYVGSGSGMRFRMEIKAAGATSSTASEWFSRGNLFIPTNAEICGARLSEVYNAIGSMPLELYLSSARHIVKGAGNGGSRTGYWFASSASGSSSQFVFLSSQGVPTVISATTAISFPLCFVVA